MTDLTIDGATFRVEVSGDEERPSVLLSHALGTDSSLWDGQVPALLENFRVVRYDSRGHGRSSLDGAPYSLARLGADALAVLDALNIETAHFVGISMGGAVGQWLLVHAPERIDRAVLADTVPRFATSDLWNARIAAVLSEGMDSLAASAMERWFGPAFRANAPDRVAAIEAVFRATPPEGYAGCCAALRDMDLRHAIRAVSNPVLILSGQDDPVASAAEIDAMMDAIHGARHVVLDCRHMSNIEAEAAFNAAVVAFLAARAPTRATPRPSHPRVATGRRPARARAMAVRNPLNPAAPKPSLRNPADGAPKTSSKGRHAAEEPASHERSPDRRSPKPPAGRVAARRAGAARKPAATGKAVAKAAKPAASRAASGRKAAAGRAAAAPKPAVGSRSTVAPRKTAAKKGAKKGAVKKASLKKTSAKKRSAMKVPSKKGSVPKHPATRRRPVKKPSRPGGRRR